MTDTKNKPGHTGKGGSSRSQAKKDEMRALANQGASHAPNLTDRINQAKELVVQHPLLSEQEAAARPTADGKPVQDRPDDHQTPDRGTDVGSEGQQVAFHIALPRGRYELVPLDLIAENPFNARKTYREARIKEMKASIAANGQETPGTATIRDGKYILAAGHYRLKALQQLDAPRMGLMVVPGLSDKALYEISYRENAEREDQTAFDNALAWRSLLATKVYQTEQELADAIGLSAPNVNKTLGILRLSEPIRELIAEDPTRYALSVLYELALFEPVGGLEQTIALAKAVANGEIGRQQIQDARARIQEKKPRKEREASRQYKITVEGVSEGTLKEWPSGKVAFEIEISDPVAREKFVAEMRERLGAKH
jgi:ParB family chromosome partitioning protein